jgi:hypothetical protein
MKCSRCRRDNPAAAKFCGQCAATMPATCPACGAANPALALVGELGMRPLVPPCHLGLGKLYVSTDNREQTREHLTTATTMYREMGMLFWLEQAEADLGAHG